MSKNEFVILLIIFKNLDDQNFTYSVDKKNDSMMLWKLIYLILKLQWSFRSIIILFLPKSTTNQILNADVGDS